VKENKIKVCRVCGKPAVNRKNRYETLCEIHLTEYRKTYFEQYYQKHKKKLKEKAVIYYAENKSKHNEYQKKYYAKNKKYFKEYHIRYYKENRIKLLNIAKDMRDLGITKKQAGAKLKPLEVFNKYMNRQGEEYLSLQKRNNADILIQENINI